MSRTLFMMNGPLPARAIALGGGIGRLGQASSQATGALALAVRALEDSTARISVDRYIEGARERRDDRRRALVKGAVETAVFLCRRGERWAPEDIAARLDEPSRSEALAAATIAHTFLREELYR